MSTRTVYYGCPGVVTQSDTARIDARLVSQCTPNSFDHAGLPLTNSRTYSAAFTDDAHFAVEEIQRRFPDAPLFAAGYSLGSLILTKYLAEADTGKWVGEGVVLLQLSVELQVSHLKEHNLLIMHVRMFGIWASGIVLWLPACLAGGSLQQEQRCL